MILSQERDGILVFLPVQGNPFYFFVKPEIPIRITVLDAGVKNIFILKSQG
jgi:hypothetical protein